MKLEQLERQRAELAEKQKQVAKAIAREKRQEKRRAEQAARQAEQDEALAVWRFCRSTSVSINITINGERRAMQLAEYIRYQMAAEQERTKAASKGGPA